MEAFTHWERIWIASVMISLRQWLTTMMTYPLWLFIHARKRWRGTLFWLSPRTHTLTLSLLPAIGPTTYERERDRSFFTHCCKEWNSERRGGSLKGTPTTLSFFSAATNFWMACQNKKKDLDGASQGGSKEKKGLLWNEFRGWIRIFSSSFFPSLIRWEGDHMGTDNKRRMPNHTPIPIPRCSLKSG